MLRWLDPLKAGPERYLDHSAAVAVGNRVYCIGGYCTYTNNIYQIGVHIFNTVSLHWLRLPPVTAGEGESSPEVPFKCHGHTAVLIHNIIYIWGGWVTYTSRYSNVLYAFDVDTHKWFEPKISGTVPEARHHHSACVLGNVMFIYGGFNKLTRPGRFHDIYKLDTTTMTWSLNNIKGTLAPASSWHSATFIGTKMFVFGGNNYYNNITVYDTETSLWRSTNSQIKPEGRKNHSAFAYNGELYIFGGNNSFQIFNDLWKCNPKTLSWSKVDPRGKGPCLMTRMCCCMVGDCVILFGGYIPSDLYILDLTPSLKTLCKLAVLQYDLEHSGLPHNVRWELAAKASFIQWERNQSATPPGTE